MKKVFMVLPVLLLLCGVGIVAWTAGGHPPVHLVWRYGFSYGPQPTGRVLTVSGVAFVEIGPGCFLMGSDRNAKGGDWLGRWCARFGLPWGVQPEPSYEMPVHWVEFPRGFWIARTEVTNEQFEAFDPQYERKVYSPEDRGPVGKALWVEAKSYCDWLSTRAGMEIRLPSEAEWECACRGGSKREFCFGDDERGLGEYAWFTDNSGGRAHEVGTRLPNDFGLYDFHGNVWEWCADSWHWSYENAPADGTAWTEGVELYRQGPPNRVARGGSFFGVGGTGMCRSAYRAFGGDPGGWKGGHGFRPAFSRPED